MDIQLKELIDKIKTEGVEEAEEKSAAIISNAERKAEEILEKAKKDRDEMVATAKSEIYQFETNAREAIKQAGRDLLLNIKKSLTDLFDSMIGKEVREGYSDSIIEEVVPLIIKKWISEGTNKIDILLSENDIKRLEDSIMQKLSNELKKGVEIKPYPNIHTGFRITERSGDSYEDFTDTGIADCLIQHMNPKLGEMIKEIVSGDK